MRELTSANISDQFMVLVAWLSLSQKRERGVKESSEDLGWGSYNWQVISFSIRSSPQSSNTKTAKNKKIRLRLWKRCLPYYGEFIQLHPSFIYSLWVRSTTLTCVYFLSGSEGQPNSSYSPHLNFKPVLTKTIIHTDMRRRRSSPMLKVCLRFCGVTQ